MGRGSCIACDLNFVWTSLVVVLHNSLITQLGVDVLVSVFGFSVVNSDLYIMFISPSCKLQNNKDDLKKRLE